MATLERSTTLVVLGASGNLAAKKLYPGIYRLFQRKLLPPNVWLVGYDPRSLDNTGYVEHLRECIKPSDDDESEFREFANRASYICSDASGEQPFVDLQNHLKTLTADGKQDRLFYLALPPKAYVPVAEQLKKHCYSTTGYNRLVIEKPFGRNSKTSLELQHGLEKANWTEEEVFRIDHYLGKEMLKNLLTLRFGNLIMDGAWSRDHIEKVTITMKEAFGTEGRGGYFDDVGIIRDVVQNHMLQILALVAMEEPASLSVQDLCSEKIRVLRSLSPMRLENTILGQYTGSSDGSKPGYKDDEGVPKHSTCPTFCKTSVQIDCDRWRGVPFILIAGKALDETKAEVRLQFKDCPKGPWSSLGSNETVIEIQPHESVRLKVNINQPGLTLQPVSTELNLTYGPEALGGEELTEAYESLILDALSGDFSLSIRKEELEALWEICTPLLDHIDSHEDIELAGYTYGSRGPV